jgi:hypothetical protein
MKVYSPAKAVSEKEKVILKVEERTALVTGGINSPETQVSIVLGRRVSFVRVFP